MKHFKITLYSLLLLGSFFAQASTTHAVVQSITKVTFNPATTLDTKAILTLNPAHEDDFLYYRVDNSACFSGTTFSGALYLYRNTPLVLSLGALSAGTHSLYLCTISFSGSTGMSSVWGGGYWRVTTSIYNPISFSVTAPASNPPSLYFSAIPTTVGSGGSAFLSWSAPRATSCTAGGAWSGTKSTFGFQMVSNITSTQTYTLYCTGSGGQSPTSSVTITVAGATPLARCSLPWGGSIASGSSVTAYQQSAVTSPVACSSVAQTRACTNGTLSGSYTYQSCVVQNPAPTATLSASPSTINTGQSSTLTWSSVNATSCTAAGGFSTGGATSGSASTGELTQDVTYQITCSNTSRSATASTAVFVQNPQVTISASPSRVSIGGSSTISWAATDVRAGNSCTISGPGLSETAKTGSRSVAISAQSEYTITCQTQDSPVTNSVIVNVAPNFQEF